MPVANPTCTELQRCQEERGQQARATETYEWLSWVRLIELILIKKVN